MERESYILFYLKGRGIPQIKTFGKTRDYFILIQTLLGPSLSTLQDNYYISFTIKDICMLSIQMLERLEFIHSKNYIHRDIKPQNFLMGLKDPNLLYIIDFGLSKKYRSKKGNHIKFAITNKITGTPRFCSINALRGAEQSRKDDLESLFYVILYFFRGVVPWQNLRIKSRVERFKKINEIKKKINFKILCKNLPVELYNFGIYIKNLQFEEDPNYSYMRKLFYQILSEIHEENDEKFSWINYINSNKSKNNNLILSHNNIFKEKPSSHKRLYDKISNLLKKKLIDKNKLTNTQTNRNNNSKDNITLVALNIENQVNNRNSSQIQKSCSYESVTDLRAKNLMKIKQVNKVNMKKEMIMKNKYIINDNFKKVERNKMINKAGKISFTLTEGNNKNDNSFNSNNNESIKNIFLRNNRIMYTSPYSLLNMKTMETNKSNINKNNTIINKEYDSKFINKKTNINQSYNHNYNNSEKCTIQNKRLNYYKLIPKNLVNNRQNSNLKYITRSYNNIHFNNNNYMNTYNGKKKN